MAETDHHMLADLPSWQTAVMILRWPNLKELQKFVTGNTFSPHWREFEANWLASTHADAGKAPSHLEIFKECLKSWHSGRNDYYLMQPETSSWDDNLGLGHYIRLLTMVVRENSASNGIWNPIKRDTELESCFEQVYMLANCMREEWARKGKLYDHFKATSQMLPARQLQYRQPVVAPRSIASTTSTNVSRADTTVKKLQNGSTPISSDDTAKVVQESHEMASVTPSQQLQNGIPSTPVQPAASQSPITIKKETLSEVGNNFLESLNAELDRKRTEIQRKVHENGSQHPSNGLPINKRPATSDSSGSNKRRKSDDIDARSISKLGGFKVPSMASIGGGSTQQVPVKQYEQKYASASVF